MTDAMYRDVEAGDVAAGQELQREVSMGDENSCGLCGCNVKTVTQDIYHDTEAGDVAVGQGEPSI